MKVKFDGVQLRHLFCFKRGVQGRARKGNDFSDLLLNKISVEKVLVHREDLSVARELLIDLL